MSEDQSEKPASWWGKEPEIACYGCLYPMAFAFESVDIDGTTYPYCISCAVWRRLKRVGPEDHEPGQVSNGTPTMRKRGKVDVEEVAL